MTSLPVSIVIPTYGRDEVLVDTLHALLALQAPAAELIVVDQTLQHAPGPEQALQALEQSGRVRRILQREPSIPQAMNKGLLAARQSRVLFLDDDIVPGAQLVAGHWEAHQAWPDALVAGKVLQPWHEGRSFAPGAPFHFACDEPQWIAEFMGGNFSVPREAAVQAGGFDENFVRVAYRFEAEFAHRWLRRGGRIRYEPGAVIHHLKVQAGGTRSYGDHRSTWRPDHAVGAYYFALRTRTWREFVSRPWQSVATRYHLRRPWRVPATLVAELRAMAWAWRLHRAGPACLQGSPE